MKVLKINLLESINDQTDALEVFFDDDSSALMFYKYGESMKFLDKEVIVDFRSEYYQGRVWDTVNTLVEPLKINTVDTESDFKLYAVDEDNYSNIVFKDLEDGDNSLSAVMLCTDQKLEASDKARWMSLTVRDKNMKYTKLRIFNYEKTDANLVGSYILCDVAKSAYGLSTKYIQKCDFVPKDTEDVVLAEKYVMNAISGDSDLISFNDRYNFIEHAKSYVELFKGAPLVQMAMELSQLQNYKNSIPDVDFDLLKRAVILSYGFVIAPNSPLSKKVLNIIKTMNPMIYDYKDVAVVIDDNEDNSEKMKEKILFRAVKSCGEDLMQVRYYND